MKISVVLTAYNAAPFLREALDSILAQTHRDLELVCVDDGSIDVTGGILDSYARNDSRVKVIHQENKGLAASRNVGVSLATGDYITFCDADDMLAPHWLSNAAALLQKSHPDLLRAHLVFDREIPANFSLPRMPRVEADYSERKDCLKWSWKVFFSGGFSVLNFIKADLKTHLRFSEKLLVKEDTVMLVNLAPYLTHVVQSDYCGYFYRNTSGSLLRRKRTAQASVRFLEALESIWQSQKVVAEQLGLLGDLKSAMQKFADNDVMDWAIDSAPESPVQKREVRSAWMRLRQAGAFDGRYRHRAFLYFPFLWWKMTGREAVIKLAWNLFLLLRKIMKRK